MREQLREELYAELMEEDRTLVLNEIIDDDCIERIVIPIMRWNVEDENAEVHLKDYERTPIKILLNSVGGSASETLSIISAIEASKTPVWTYVLGKASSGGFFILISGHKRFAQKYSTIMFHSIQLGFGHDVKPMQTADEIMVETKRLQKVFDEIVINHTKIPKKQINDVIEKKLDMHLSSKEALALGCIDEIV